MAAVHHLGFLKFETLLAARVKSIKVCHHAKFHEDQSNCCRDNTTII